MKWQTYRDADYHFRVDYPSNYAVTERKIPSELRPRPLHVVAFLSRDLAQSATAEFQPPAALIEVFANPTGKALSDWIGADKPAGQRSTLRVGDLLGYRVTLPILLAPNEFAYFVDDAYVYRLTFLDEYAEQMLQSFRIEH